MKLFSLDPSSYLSRSLTSRLAASESGHQLVGPTKDAANNIDAIVAQALSPDVNALLIDLQAPGREQDILTLLEAVKTANFAETHPGGFFVYGISTVLTWNQTQKSSKKSNKESAYRNRRCSPRYKSVRYLEGLVLSAQREGLVQSYVVAPGILYGNGEDDLHYLFKQAWMHAGESNFEGLPLIGDGKNVIPTIHVFDLCTILRTLLDTPPQEQQYFVAVDAGHTTQKALVTAIAQGLSEGKIKSVDKLDEKVLLAASIAAGGTSTLVQPDEPTATPVTPAASSSAAIPATTVTPAQLTAANSLTNNNPEIILADMKFESEFLSAGIEWVCEQGPASSPEVFEAIRAEFVKARNLKPVRLMVTGAPGSGKSYYSSLLSKQYYIPHVRLTEVIQWTLDKKDEFAERVQNALNESEKQLKANKKNKEKAKAKAAASGSAAAPSKSSKKAATPKDGAAGAAPVDLSLFDTDNPRLSPYLLSKLMKTFVRQPLLRNKGFVLDGFPRTNEESLWFFSPDVEEDSETGEPLSKPEDKKALARAAEAAGEEEDNSGLPGEPAEPTPRDLTTMVDSVIALTASESLAADRLKKLPLEQVLAGHNDEEGFHRRWGRYVAIMDLNPVTGLPQNAGEAALSPLAFIQDSVEVLELPESTAADTKEAVRLIKLYVGKKGTAFNYHPTEEEISAEQETREKETAVRQAKEVADAREKAAIETNARSKADANHALRRAAVLLEDSMLIDASSAPIRSYLMQNVIPALVDGLLDVCKTQPEDPVDYLAEYLFKYSVDTPLDTENAQNRPGL